LRSCFHLREKRGRGNGEQRSEARERERRRRREEGGEPLEALCLQAVRDSIPDPREKFL
jgi:hypothetical protein